MISKYKENKILEYLANGFSFAKIATVLQINFKTIYTVCARNDLNPDTFTHKGRFTTEDNVKILKLLLDKDLSFNEIARSVDCDHQNVRAIYKYAMRHKFPGLPIRPKSRNKDDKRQLIEKIRLLTLVNKSVKDIAKMLNTHTAYVYKLKRENNL